MKVSDLVASQLTEVKQILSMNVLKSINATSTAQSITMMEDFQQTQQVIEGQTIKPAPHPYAGQHLDLKG